MYISWQNDTDTERRAKNHLIWLLMHGLYRQSHKKGLLPKVVEIYLKRRLEGLSKKFPEESSLWEDQ